MRNKDVRPKVGRKLNAYRDHVCYIICDLQVISLTQIIFSLILKRFIYLGYKLLTEVKMMSLISCLIST